MLSTDIVREERASMRQITFNVKERMFCPQRLATRKTFPIFSLSFNIVLEVLARATREEKKKKTPRLERKK
jgi:hypothetical protein